MVKILVLISMFFLLLMRVRNSTDKFIVFPSLHSSLSLRSIFQFNNWITSRFNGVLSPVIQKAEIYSQIPNRQHQNPKIYVIKALHSNFSHFIFLYFVLHLLVLSVVCSMFMLSFLTQLLTKENIWKVEFNRFDWKKNLLVFLSDFVSIQSSQACQREVDLFIGSPWKKKMENVSSKCGFFFENIK